MPVLLCGLRQFHSAAKRAALSLLLNEFFHGATLDLESLSVTGIAFILLHDARSM